MTQSSEGVHKHHYHSPYKRALYSFSLAAAVLFFGTIGIHWLEGFSWIDAFYFTSMIATGQGPAPDIKPVTMAGKIFTCFFAFISVGSMIASLGFVFGPFLGKLLKIGFIKLEEELHIKKHS